MKNEKTKFEKAPSAEVLQATLLELGYGVPLLVARSWGWTLRADVQRWAQWTLGNYTTGKHPTFPQFLARFDLSIKNHQEGETQ